MTDQERLSKLENELSKIESRCSTLESKVAGLEKGTTVTNVTNVVTPSIVIPGDETPTKSKLNRRYGYKPDIADQRDYNFEQLNLNQVKAVLPPSTDLRATCSAVEDQGQLGSCTANALAGALEFLEDKDKLPMVRRSRLYIYWNERFLQGTVRSDSGATLREGISTLLAYGSCPESEWPYNINQFTVKPNAGCYTVGKTHVIQSYYRINTMTDMKTCLAAGYPFVFGFTVYESFESDQVAQTGIVPMPGPNEQALGGHAVMCVGYNDATKRWLIRNSWGAGWGQQGYFTLPYGYLTLANGQINTNLASDFWYISRAKGL
jgi:C1A family cysteine protease